MTESKKLSWKRIFIFGMILTAWLLRVLGNSGTRRAVFSLEEVSMGEEESITLETSTDFRYQDQFRKTLLRYREFGRIYREELSTAVPGLEYTGIGDSYSLQMVPQGICIAGDYMLISAYDKGMNGKTEPSVIYVLSWEAGTGRELLTTLVLPDRNHVGGLTFDGEYVWIAKSTTGYISGISYERIEEAVSLGQSSYILRDYSCQLYAGVTASFVSFGHNRLWVGTFSSGIGKNSMLYGYRLCKGMGRITIEQECAIEIPPHAQGVTFLERNQTSYMALTTSYGRFWDSGVYLYEVEEGGCGAGMRLLGAYRFPPMAQELVSDGTHTYFLFESAASCYSAMDYFGCAYPVDRICGVENEQFFAEAVKIR